MRCPGPLMALALCRLVGEVDDARAKALGADKLQRLPIAPVLKETLPAVRDDGMDHEPELVEKVVAQQRPDQGVGLPVIEISLPSAASPW
jgi:hypothetical protein